MKNIYQKPETTVIKIHTTQMIASSPAAPMYDQDATGEAMSRQGGSFWGDDEDDADDYDEQEETFGYTGF